MNVGVARAPVMFTAVSAADAIAVEISAGFGKSAVTACRAVAAVDTTVAISAVSAPAAATAAAGQAAAKQSPVLTADVLRKASSVG